MTEHGCLVDLGSGKTHLTEKHNCCMEAAGMWYPYCLQGAFEGRLVWVVLDRVVCGVGGDLTVSVCLDRRVSAKGDEDNREEPVWSLKFDAWR